MLKCKCGNIPTGNAIPIVQAGGPCEQDPDCRLFAEEHRSMERAAANAEMRAYGEAKRLRKVNKGKQTAANRAARAQENSSRALSTPKKSK